MIKRPPSSCKIVSFNGRDEMEKAYKVCKGLVESWGYLSGNTVPVYLVNTDGVGTDDYDDIAELYMGLYSLGTVNRRDGEDKLFEKLIDMVNHVYNDWLYIVFSPGSDWGNRTPIDNSIILSGSYEDLIMYSQGHVKAQLSLAKDRTLVSLRDMGTKDAYDLFRKYLSRYATSDRLIDILNSIPGLFIKFVGYFEDHEYGRILKCKDNNNNRYLLRIDY